MCVVSAVIAVLVILTAALVQIILFYVNPEWLNLWNNVSTLQDSSLSNSTNNDELMTTITLSLNKSMLNKTLSILARNSTNSDTERAQEGIGFCNTVFLTITATIVILAAITAGLLLHLCFFHIYISYLGLTTYEYIRNHRQSNVLNTIDENKPVIKEVYVCSKIKLPEWKHRPKTLHTCRIDATHVEDTEAYSNITVETSANLSHKSFYMCTILEKTQETTNHISVGSDNAPDVTRSFHGCSEFSHHSAQSCNGAQKMLHYTEQCTFCSFRIRSSKKQEHSKKRCCVKALSKHHRWRRKLNCCSNVPNSPEDIPSDSLRSIASASLPFHASIVEITEKSSAHPKRCAQMEVPIENESNQCSNFSHNDLSHGHSNESNDFVHKFEITPETSNMDGTGALTTISSLINNSTISVKRTRPKLIRPWPVRLRHMFRVINRYRRRRLRGVSTLKQNQIRPIPTVNSNYDIYPESASLSNYHNDVQVATNPPPSAPPPSRRKIKSSCTRVQNLTDALSIIQSSNGIPVLPNHQIRRQKRKNFLNRCPTLSPIHESGLSNQTSPQLCRHSCSGSISSIGSSSLCRNQLANTKPLI